MGGGLLWRKLHPHGFSGLSQAQAVLAALQLQLSNAALIEHLEQFSDLFNGHLKIDKLLGSGG
jgi:hypothetical protein